MPIIQCNTGPTSATRGLLVVPSDANDLEFTTKELWVGGAGTLKVTMAEGDTVTLAAVAAGTRLKLSVSRIWATGTTCTGIIALWE